jgi:predicted nucleic-acid-binding protein
MTDRFDLEQQILNCWSVVDDIKTLRWQIMENNSEKSITAMTDKVDNYLLGLEHIYQAKFEYMFHVFETLIQDKKII